MLAQPIKMLHQTLNMHIQNHLVEGSSRKILYLIRKHSIFLFLMYAANFCVL